MQARYVILIAKATLDLDAEIAVTVKRTGLVVVSRGDRFAILVNDTQHVIPCADDAGAILGAVYSRSSPPRRIRSLQGSALERVRKGGFASLLTDYWGPYVALRQCDNAIRILRDPSGGLPCYYADDDRRTLVTSDIDLLFQATGLHPRIDWSFLTWHLWSSLLRSSQTAFVGIKELPVGHELEVGGETTSVTARWSPWDFASDELDLSDRDLAALLGETVRDCVQALASGYDHIALGVSGGLDSSIVAACINGRVPLTCFTMVTNDPDGDERRHAAELTRALGLPLRVWAYDEQPANLEESMARHLPRPVGRPHTRPMYAHVDELARYTGVDALFTGNGGDNVFCLMRSASPVADRLTREGVGIGTLKTFLDACRLTDSTFWHIARESGRGLARGTAPYSWRPEPQYLHLPADRNLLHLWLDRPLHVLFGKAVHVARILQIQHSAEGTDRRSQIPLVTPLLSQPIVELCLRIQTWRWIRDGRERAVVRTAFSDDLPAAILNRQSKGGPDGYIFELYETHQAWLHDWFAKGLLAQHGVVDLDAILAALGRSTMLKGTGYIRLLELADAEAWARYWTSRSYGF